MKTRFGTNDLMRNIIRLSLLTLLLLPLLSCNSGISNSLESPQSKFLLHENNYTVSHINNDISNIYSDSTDFATIYFYRPILMFGHLMEFDIYLDDEFLCRSEPNWGQRVEVTLLGKQKLRTKSKKNFSLSVKLESGKEYFIQCSVGFGFRAGKPHLKLIEASEGRNEYNKVVGQVIACM